MSINNQTLAGFGATAAILGGSLRVVSTFIPYTPDSPELELLYGAVDLLMLFGLMAIYYSTSQVLGWIGLAGFVLAAASLASIVGPDPTMFGVSFYEAGAAGLLIGLATLSIALLMHRRLLLAALLWLAALASALIGILSSSLLAINLAGLLLGLGFAAAGIQLNSSSAAPTRALR
jgi:hypothetical protein